MATETYSLLFDGYWRAPNIAGLPSASGVYCVYACTHNVQGGTVSIRNLLYIGEASNVRNRVAGHERWAHWQSYLLPGEELCFNAASIASASDRQRTEAAMIFRHKPLCNLEYVNTFPFDVTTILTGGDSARLDDVFTVYRTDADSLTALLAAMAGTR
ncbi:MAG: GIY-YIG nuclease family protein [Vicinamibacteraceae bacterium]